jgi:hypothetical protein
MDQKKNKIYLEIGLLLITPTLHFHDHLGLCLIFQKEKQRELGLGKN